MLLLQWLVPAPSFCGVMLALTSPNGMVSLAIGDCCTYNDVQILVLIPIAIFCFSIDIRMSVASNRSEEITQTTWLVSSQWETVAI